MNHTRLLLLLILFFSFFLTQAQNPESINLLKADLKDHQSLNNSLRNSRLIFTGENHAYIRIDRTNELRFIRYLSENYNVNDYLIEQGYSLAALTNKYIHGDTSYRKIMYALTSYPYFLLFDSIRIFNNSLPVEKQITIHGIDVERTFSSSVLLLDKLLPARLPEDDSLLLEIETIKSMAARYLVNFDSSSYFYDRQIDYYYTNNYCDGSYGYEKYSSVERSLKEILNSFNRKKSRYQTYLKGDFAEFETIINSLLEYRQWDSYSDDNTLQSYLYREEIIYKNMKKLLVDNNKKYYGQFGRMHIARCVQNKDAGYYYYRSFVNRLIDNDSTLSNKITTIALVYEDDRSSNSKDKTEMNEFANSFKNEQTTILTEIDKKEYPLIAQKYDFAIVYSYSTEKANKSTPVSSSLIKEVGTFEMGVILNQDAGIADINKKLGMKYPSDLLLVNMRINALTYDNFYYNIGFFVGANTPTRSINDSFTIKFSKGAIYNNFGYNLYLGKKLIVAPYIGIGWNFASVNHSFLKTTLDSFSLSQTRVIKTYTNNAFTVNGGLNIKVFPTENFYFTAECNYMADVSNKAWIFNMKNQIDNFPKYSHTGLYYMLGIGVVMQ